MEPSLRRKRPGKNRANDYLTETTLINTDAELRAFCKQYHVDRNEIKEIY